MKLLPLLLLFSIAASAQTKAKPFKWPKPIKDSVYHIVECDTTFGKIEMQVGEGVMIAEGFVTSCRQYDCNQKIYTPKDRAYIDSTQHRQGWWASDGMCSSWGEPRKDAYMKTSSGYKRIEGKFVFRPN